MSHPPAVSEFARRDRTWWIAGSLVIVAFWTVMVLSNRDYASYKITLRDHFIVHDENIDQDIEIFRSRPLLVAYRLYFRPFDRIDPDPSSTRFSKSAVRLDHSS